MSSHCDRYPSCGCSDYVGTKCDIPTENLHLFQGKEVKRDEKGYPLLETGGIDWELTLKEKQIEADKWERMKRGKLRKAPHRKYPSNYTPPKKRRK